jgi:hypothetical protein
MSPATLTSRWAIARAFVCAITTPAQDAFGTANSTVAGSLRMLTDAVDDADAGAAACKLAADRLGDVGKDLSQAALMAVAGCV